MIKKKFFTILLIFLFYSNNSLFGEIKIIVSVDDEIITNYDLNREINYLEILNPSLVQVNNDQKLEIAKTSLINEIIKKKEIKKLMNMDKKNQFTDEYLKNLYMKANFESEAEFEKKLSLKNNYNLSQVKEKIELELFWNELIYVKYKNQLNINKEEITNKVENLENKKIQEFFLSEILFTKKKNKKLEDTIKEIKLSINEIGFNNTANIYSISETSKFGGKVGWLSENSLSDLIKKELLIINKGEFTKIMKLGNNFLILKIEDIRFLESNIDKDKEIERLIQIETNKQLNRFSKIFFDKLKINYSINEN
tara:strand:- start:392 stop:1321 length:930 start_codon:yes stop_codon:yes gene_type:complete